MIKKLTVLASALLVSYSAIATNVQEVNVNEKNLIKLTTGIDGDSVFDTIQAIEKNNEKVIFLYINSPGGSVLDGIVLVDYLKSTKKNIHCIANYAASMAHAILQACPVRLATTTNYLMQHRMTVGTEGTADDIRNTLKIMGTLSDLLDKMEAKRIGITLTEFRNKVLLPWVTAGEESLSENVVDGIVTIKCSSALIKKVTKERQRTIFGPVEITTSACPTIPMKIEQKESR